MKTKKMTVTYLGFFRECLFDRAFLNANPIYVMVEC